MALKGAPIWVSSKTRCSHLGVSDLGSSRSGFGLNLRFDSERFRKWECCSLAAALAQRATTPVEDEKPSLPLADTSGKIEGSQDNESSGFHKDLNLLPSKFALSRFKVEFSSWNMLNFYFSFLFFFYFYFFFFF